MGPAIFIVCPFGSGKEMCLKHKLKLGAPFE
jgi:hypothetical protein